jgi:RNA recognition motif-containing protein
LKTAECIFIGNVPFGVRVGELEDLFQACGTVRDLFLGKNRQGESKGYAFLRFETNEQAKAAVLR